MSTVVFKFQSSRQVIFQAHENQARRKRLLLKEQGISVVDEHRAHDHSTDLLNRCVDNTGHYWLYLILS